MIGLPEAPSDSTRQVNSTNWYVFVCIHMDIHTCMYMYISVPLIISITTFKTHGSSISFSLQMRMYVCMYVCMYVGR